MAFEDIEMKDIILATLAEIENDTGHNKKEKSNISENLTIDLQDGVIDDFIEHKDSLSTKQEENKKNISELEKEKNKTINEEQKLASILNKLEENTQSEDEFLSGMKERLMVLFEGLKISSNHKLEKKLSLTMSYLEYTLAIIDERLDEKNKKIS
ncbi:hypothetical protein MNB_ARC-1_789 [hydrothermal vent metagenome]|uniref:Campylobacter invasion antigen D C-terminal domain-containing protein n=1 Tax=hydrothermal vent metagenome TaxID=652676 RepID=A0A3B1DY76_9ZZZZ